MKPIFAKPDKKVIFFDFNDTLLDKGRSFVSAYAETLTEFTARWEMEGWNPHTAAERYWLEWTKRRRTQLLKKTASPRTKPPTFNQLQTSCIRKSLEHVGSPFPLTDVFISRLHRRAKELAPLTPQLFPDVKETLEQLAGSYQLAIISNGSRHKLETHLLHAGLKPLFPDTHIYVPASRAERKPGSAIFQQALTGMNVLPSEAVMVGNSWRNDIFGANRCRIDAVWLRHGQHKKTGSRRIGRNQVISISRCKQLLLLFE